MTRDHDVPGIRNQRGPLATCRARGCGRQVRWSVMQDRWLHVLTPAQEAERVARVSEEAIAMMRGLARDLRANGALFIETPDQVEAILRGTR